MSSSSLQQKSAAEGTTANNEPPRICIPGQLLHRVSQGEKGGDEGGGVYHAGNGCYEFHGAVYASLAGFVHIFQYKDSQGVEGRVVEVRRKFGEKNAILPATGRIVTARVEQISQRVAKCSILCVEDTLLPAEFNSTLRKEDVREKEKDKVELYKFVQPGDIILARVLGYGETQTAYLLTIAEDQLGVIMARGQRGERLVPETADTVKATVGEYREPRKRLVSVQLDVHPVEPALQVRFEITDEEGASRRREQKIVYLKALSPDAEPAAVASLVLDSCPDIPRQKLEEIEQLVFYLQKRLVSSGDDGQSVTNGHSSAVASSFGGKKKAPAKIEELDKYLEMLYDDTEKCDAVARILDLCQNTAANNDWLEVVGRNEVLMGALTRVFKEDSRKNLELATNLLSIFHRFSQFAEYHPMFSHWKIGALTMQLIEFELKRWDQWREQANSISHVDEESERKWRFALQRQDQLLTVAVKTLKNLAEDIRVESKMLKRDLLKQLIHCLDHTDSIPLLHATVHFLWKLSAFTENLRLLSDLSGVLEKLVALLPLLSSSTSRSQRSAGSRPLESRDDDDEEPPPLLGLLFNLATFDGGNRRRLVAAGLVQAIASAIDRSPMALALLYQMSLVDDAKAMFAYTDAIPSLLSMLFDDGDRDEERQAADPGLHDDPAAASLVVVKSLLVNATLEKRNAQLVCAGDSHGLDSLMSYALENEDVLAMKIARNIAGHPGTTQAMFASWLPQLVENALSTPQLLLLTLPTPTESEQQRKKRNNQKSPGANSGQFAVECLGVCACLLGGGGDGGRSPAQGVMIDWARLDSTYGILAFIRQTLGEFVRRFQKRGQQSNRPGGGGGATDDKVFLQLVVWLGTLVFGPGQLELARRAVLEHRLVPHLLETLEVRQEDDEFVLQVVYVLACLLAHASSDSALSEELCGSSVVVETLIHLMHDKNPRLRELCDRCLETITKTNAFWRARIVAERFRWHNAHWLEMVAVASQQQQDPGEPGGQEEGEGDERMGESQDYLFPTTTDNNNKDSFSFTSGRVAVDADQLLLQQEQQ